MSHHHLCLQDRMCKFLQKSRVALARMMWTKPHIQP